MVKILPVEFYPLQRYYPFSQDLLSPYLHFFVASRFTESQMTSDTKLPRRRLLVQFTCNECGERT